MALKTEHFTTPIKLILPGIIVSLIGLTASNYIFNDPVKIRGKHSRTAWDNLARYQKIYEQNAEGLTCQYAPNIGEYYFKDLIHLQEMTIENLKMLKEDKEIDKIVGSIINLRIDTYTQLKNLTVDYIDTLMVLDKYDQAISDPAIRKQLEAIVQNIQIEYITERQHISTRDTSIISNLGSELKKTYTAFENASFRSASLSDIIDTIHRKIVGKWSMIKEAVQVEVNFNSTNQGSIMMNNKEEKFSWKFLGKDSTRLDVDFENGLLLDWKLDISYVSEKLMQYKDIIENGVVLTACRVKEE